MTKKDLIIIAVLANMGVLAILFMLAVREDEEPAQDLTEINYVIQDIQDEPQTSSLTSEEADTIDDMEALLSKNNSMENSNAFAVEEEIPLLDQEPSSSTPEDSDETKEEPTRDSSRVVEITVKRGDALEKLARSNGTTVEAIKKANNLKSDKLKIGQVLQIPVGNSNEMSAPSKKVAKVTNSTSEQFYTIKHGDNPWKIAKQYNMRVDELLKLNDLDEAKAKNLKIGDQIRVK
jgi:LysM repeat protein